MRRVRKKKKETLKVYALFLTDERVATKCPLGIYELSREGLNLPKFAWIDYMEAHFLRSSNIVIRLGKWLTREQAPFQENACSLDETGPFAQAIYQEYW
jgi:hypothetical protein